MTESPETTARRLLEVLARIKDLLRNHGIVIRRQKNVSRTQDALEVIPYNSGPVIEGYVEAELQDGSAISWLLDVTWNNEQWKIAARLTRSARDTQETLWELEEQTVSDFEQFTNRLTEVVKQLLLASAPGLNS